MVSNNYLINNLLNVKGFSVLRLGNVEATSLMLQNQIYEQLYTNAGFYGDDKTYKKWKNLTLKALINMDIHLNVVSCPSFEICRDLITKLNIWCPTISYIERIDFWLNVMEIFKK